VRRDKFVFCYQLYYYYYYYNHVLILLQVLPLYHYYYYYFPVNFTHVHHLHDNRDFVIKGYVQLFLCVTLFLFSYFWLGEYLICSASALACALMLVCSFWLELRGLLQYEIAQNRNGPISSLCFSVCFCVMVQLFEGLTLLCPSPVLQEYRGCGIEIK